MCSRACRSSRPRGSTVAKVRDELGKIETLLKAKDVPPIPAADSGAPADSAPTGEDYIRVSAGRINETLNAVSEVFLLRNQLVYLVERLKADPASVREFLQRWESLDNALRRGIGDIERCTMSMRMTAVQSLFLRMERVVKSYVSQSGKQIQFRMFGETTELDKKVLDTLGEPLIHLIRNAMDHGIEAPDARQAAGKPAQGTITLGANVVGNEVLLHVSDDGAGIDGKKLLAAARAKGLDVSSVADERSAIELIFMAGFSTAKTVTDVSGRGVGMDAVRTSIQSLGGGITIQTEVGKGTTFVIRLLISMSLVPSVLVEINRLQYAVCTCFFHSMSSLISRVYHRAG